MNPNPPSLRPSSTLRLGRGLVIAAAFTLASCFSSLPPRKNQSSEALPPTFSEITPKGVRVESHITDADGVQGVIYSLFADASASQAVESNATGVFLSLAPATTYWALTTAKTLNATSGSWEQSTSPVASFQTQTLYQITFSAGEGGTVGADASQQVIKGEDAKPVQAIPNEGYSFKEWTDGQGWSSPSNPLTLLGVTSDRNLTASFSKLRFTLDFSTGDGGLLTGPLTQTVEYGGNAAAVTAETLASYGFTGWMEGGVLVTTDLALCPQALLASHAYAATFQKSALPVPRDYSGCSVIVASATEDVVLTLTDQAGGYEMDFGYVLDGNKVVVGNTTNLVFPQEFNLGKFAAGTELKFFINISEYYVSIPGGYTYVSGEESANPDGMIHDHFVLKPDGSWTFGFEDLYGGGDYDFDDIFFALKGPVRVRQAQKAASLRFQDVVLPTGSRSAGQLVTIPVILSGLVRDEGATDISFTAIASFSTQQLTYVGFTNGDSQFDRSRFTVGNGGGELSISYNLTGIGEAGQLRDGTMLNLQFKLNADLPTGGKFWLSLPDRVHIYLPTYQYKMAPSTQRMRPVQTLPGGVE